MAKGKDAGEERARAPFLVRKDLLERARAVVFYYGEGLTMAQLGEEGLEHAVKRYEAAYLKDRGRPVPAMPKGATIRGR